MTVAFTIHPIPARVLDEIRASRLDVSGSPVEYVTASGGDPLRCCLRNAEPGEELMLFGYQPPMPPSPYREIGAVLAHAQPCPGAADLDRYPPDWYGRPQVLRAYDRRGWIHDATTVHDGDHPEKVIEDILADPDVVQIHSRNIAWGCYMFAITRTA
jgi:Protein of unknown function (DUF1203)